MRQLSFRLWRDPLWSLLGGPSDAAPNASLADVTLKTAGELLYAHLLLFRLLHMT